MRTCSNAFIFLKLKGGIGRFTEIKEVLIRSRRRNNVEIKNSDKNKMTNLSNSVEFIFTKSELFQVVF